MYSSLVLVVISGFLKMITPLMLRTMVTQASEIMTFGRKMNYFHKQIKLSADSFSRRVQNKLFGECISTGEDKGHTWTFPEF